jgi:hypothetical protein
MQLVDRIEKRRFVGREFLLWLWFESDLRGGTLPLMDGTTADIWPVAEAGFASGKESTRIKGEHPLSSREAKECLLLGKSPEKIGFKVTLLDREFTFSMKGDTLALGRLKLPTVLQDEPDALAAMGPGRGPTRGPKTSVAQDEERGANDRAEQFYERMQDARELEAALELLYSAYLRLRLGTGWASTVQPAMLKWVKDTPVDDAAYVKAIRAFMPAKPVKKAKA